MGNFLELQALKVNQPLGEFYVVSISAKDLLSVSFSEPLRYIDSSGAVQGSQRVQDDKRLKEIATYIETVEMAFPNSIILGANYNKNGIISKDGDERWRITKDENCGTFKLIIPQELPLAAIIDGQHRLKAFQHVTKQERFDDLQLLCSVYFDLPNSYQAFLFATINSNQKRVNRSVALEQFGYNVDDEPEMAWTPEKFAVFLSRKLNVDSINSAFYQHIKVTLLDGDKLFPDGLRPGWEVSTATIVDGIDGLITSNAKRDRVMMQEVSVFKGRNRSMIKKVKDVSPLRELFINGNDQAIYDIITSFFNAFRNQFWLSYNEKSYIFKTVGVQAAFDVLKLILNKESGTLSASIDFENYLAKAKGIDFSDKFFQASGIGRGRIKNIIALATGLIGESKIKKTDIPFYLNIINGKTTDTEKEIMQWDEDAENAVIAALEKTNWNYDNKSVSIDLNEDYETLETFTKYDAFYSHLVSLAETGYAGSLPTDPDFAEQQRENFDPEDLVNSCLIEYEVNLRKLGWAQ
ncbi:DGQHR domain-containing protein [Pedobacter punctiformis]|uniref:DGQHR domain-containing protein n=1 Tax=Pedobacter punctiformis TaxID=3004097 RepID=A0ABT4LC05_9SPHI|nr:DGQHR domain-containing protein [Pedobacter sp. HCMS5-2]MCZ4245460.1 DGQHR domain-containing protein [Pedobacter sp. HCMS5-2]